MTKPVIAVTMGDAAGIGPEVVVKALVSETVQDSCRPLLIGPAAVIKPLLAAYGPGWDLYEATGPGDIPSDEHTLAVLDLHNLAPADIVTGTVCPACGKAAMENIAAAADLALRGEVQAIVTAPINKESISRAGYKDTGHLEYLARITGAKDYATMLAAGPLRVVHLTTHYSLKEACSMVRKDFILARLELIHRSFQQWGIRQARIGVPAINPHGGEGGLFGREEVDEIMPAVGAAQADGIDARGPYPADSIFTRAARGEFDVVLAMYHDQGHIPIKMLDFEHSISVALGLPFIRTSVDHGTAFDIAGKGIADATSMVEAIRCAVGLVEGRLI